MGFDVETFLNKPDIEVFDELTKKELVVFAKHLDLKVKTTRKWRIRDSIIDHLVKTEIFDKEALQYKEENYDAIVQKRIEFEVELIMKHRKLELEKISLQVAQLEAGNCNNSDSSDKEENGDSLLQTCSKKDINVYVTENQDNETCFETFSSRPADTSVITLDSDIDYNSSTSSVPNIDENQVHDIAIKSNFPEDGVETFCTSVETDELMGNNSATLQTSICNFMEISETRNVFVQDVDSFVFTSGEKYFEPRNGYLQNVSSSDVASNEKFCDISSLHFSSPKEDFVTGSVVEDSSSFVVGRNLFSEEPSSDKSIETNRVSLGKQNFIEESPSCVSGLVQSSPSLSNLVQCGFSNLQFTNIQENSVSESNNDGLGICYGSISTIDSFDFADLEPFASKRSFCAIQTFVAEKKFSLSEDVLIHAPMEICSVNSVAGSVKESVYVNFPVNRVDLKKDLADQEKEIHIETTSDKEVTPCLDRSSLALLENKLASDQMSEILVTESQLESNIDLPSPEGIANNRESYDQVTSNHDKYVSKNDTNDNKGIQSANVNVTGVCLHEPVIQVDDKGPLDFMANCYNECENYRNESMPFLCFIVQEDVLQIIDPKSCNLTKVCGDFIADKDLFKQSIIFT